MDPQRDNGPHAIIKRARAPHYHPNHILLWKPEIDEFTNALMDKMRKYYTHIEGQQKPFDCLVLFRRLMVDIAFVTLYGKRIESVKQWDVIGFKTDPAEAIVRSIKLWIFHNILKSVVPRPVWAIFAALPIAAIKPMMNSEATVRFWNNDPVYRPGSKLRLRSSNDRSETTSHAPWTRSSRMTLYSDARLPLKTQMTTTASAYPSSSDSFDNPTPRKPKTG